MAGISARHGAHHDAHKLTTTTLPRKSANLSRPPPNSSRSKSGAAKPTCGAAEVVKADRVVKSREATIQPPPSTISAAIKAVKRLVSINQRMRYEQ